MVNRNEGQRNSSEELKLAAYEAAQSKRSENAKELSEKVEPVRSTIMALEGTHEEVLATLKEFKGTKKEISKIKENFFDLIKDNNDVRDYVVGLVEGKKQVNSEKEGELVEPEKEYKDEKERKKAKDDQLFKDYMKFVGVEDDKSGLVEKYGEVDERFKSLSKELRSGVRGRKAAKEELLNALKENNPEQKYGTYKELEKEAEKQTNIFNPESIEGKEIKNYVDGLVEKFKGNDKLSEVTSKLSKNPYGSNFDLKNLFSEGDFVALQKYGPQYAGVAKEYFLKKILEEAKANLNIESGDNSIRKEDIEKRLSSAIGESWEETSTKASLKNRDMEKILSIKRNMETFEKVTPEVEDAFSSFEEDTDLGSNMYTKSIRSFENRNDGMVVEFIEGHDDTIIQQYLNFEYPDSRAPNGKAHHGFLGLENVRNNLDKLNVDLTKEQEDLNALQKKQLDFNKRSWFGKIGKSEEIRSINRELSYKNELIEKMQAAQKLLVGTKNFMANIDKVQKDNGINMGTKVVQFDREKKGFGFKDKIKESLNKRLGQE